MNQLDLGGRRAVVTGGASGIGLAIAQRLIQENDLPGEFYVFEIGLLGLDVLATDRTFFHDGIVFASLDAVNNPGKNPTITQLAIGS